MISKNLDDLIKAYPNKDKFYSLQKHYFDIKKDKISRHISASRILAFSNSAKELFELAHKKYAIDGINEISGYYSALDIMVLTGFKSKNIYKEKSSRSKYNKDLKLNMRIRLQERGNKNVHSRTD